MYNVIYSPVETGHNITYYREVKGFTRERFGQMIHLDTDAVIEIENGIRDLSLAKVAKISNVLSVPANWILGFVEESE